MGRACDCCGDDDEIICGGGEVRCPSCEQPCVTQRVDDDFFDDVICVVTLAYDEGKDISGVEFIEESTYDIYIGPLIFTETTRGISGQPIRNINNFVSDKSIYHANYRDELNYATKIATTAPFTDSRACSGYNPVCKCITQDYYDPAAYPRFSLAESTYYRYDPDNYKSILSPYVGEAGYVVKKLSFSECNKIGGQFLFSESDCDVEEKYISFVLFGEGDPRPPPPFQRPDGVLYMASGPIYNKRHQDITNDDIRENFVGEFEVFSDWDTIGPVYEFVNSGETTLSDGPCYNNTGSGVNGYKQLIDSVTDSETGEELLIHSITTSSWSYVAFVGWSPSDDGEAKGRAVNQAIQTLDNLFNNAFPGLDGGISYGYEGVIDRRHPEGYFCDTGFFSSMRKTADLDIKHLGTFAYDRFSLFAQYYQEAKFEPLEGYGGGGAGALKRISFPPIFGYSAIRPDESTPINELRPTLIKFGYFNPEIVTLTLSVPETSPTFDPSIKPEIPNSPIKISTLIITGSDKALSQLEFIANDNGDIPNNVVPSIQDRYACSWICDNGSLADFNAKEEIKYAIENNQIIKIDNLTDIIKQTHKQYCSLYYSFGPDSNGYFGSDKYRGVSLIVDEKDSHPRLYSSIKSWGIYNNQFKRTLQYTYSQHDASYYDFFLEDLSDLQRYYRCPDCTKDELLQESANGRMAVHAIISCNYSVDPCCTLQENIDKYKLKIIRPELDYEGKEPALYKHYYIANEYSFNNTNAPFYSDEVKLPNIEPIKYTFNMFSDGGQEYSCSFTSDALDGQYLSTGMEGLVGCFNPENEYCKTLLFDYILRSFYLGREGFQDAVGLTSSNYTYNYNPIFGVGWRESVPWYLVNDEALRPDCLYDLLLSSPPPDNTTCYTCFATQYLATFEGYDGVSGISNITSGTMYGNVKSNVISDDPYIYKDGNRCMWHLPCPPYNSPATLNQIKCGGLYADATCGVIGSQLSSLELPIFKSIPDPGSDCLLTQQIGTYTHYYSAGSSSYAMDGYCNPEQDFPPDSDCRNDSALKKTTTTEWLEKSMGRACGGMVSLPYTLQGDVCQNQDKLWKWEILPDPRERYNKDIYTLRLKDAKYKSGDRELDFSKAEERQDGDGNTFFYIRGEPIENFFDTSKIEMGNAVELVRDAYQDVIDISIIGAGTVELGTGLELRYSFIGDSQIKLQLIYPAFLQGYSVDYIGKTLDIFGSRRCVDDCCTEYDYDPPAIEYSSCPYGGQGVDGSIKNAEGYNAGFTYWRKTAFYRAAAQTVPRSYKINKITMRVIQVVINCANFELLDNIETLIDNDQNFDFIVDAGPRIVNVGQQLQLPIPLSCFQNGPVFNDGIDGNELCPAAPGEKNFKTQDSLNTAYTPIQTELIRDE